MKYLLAFSLSLVVIAPWYALWQADEYCTQLEYDLNVSNTAIAIYKAENKRLREENSKLGIDKLREENVGLRKANQCLLDYAEKDRCITAIKHSPLPKLAKETR